MPGSGGASSPAYPDYIQGIHNIVLRGGTMDDDSSDADPSATEWGLSLSVLNRLASGMLFTTQLTADAGGGSVVPIRDEMSKYVYDPTGSKDVSIIEFIRDATKTLAASDTSLTADQIVSFVTDAKDVDSLRDNFDTDTFLNLMYAIIGETYTFAESDNQASLVSNTSNVNTMFDSLKNPIKSDMDNLINSSITDINAALNNVSHESEITDTTDLIGNLTTTILNSVESRIATVMNKMFSINDEYRSDVENMVNSYKAQTLANHSKATGRISASMGQQGSNMSSAFASALSELEVTRNREIQDYRVQIEAEFRDRIFAMYQNTGQEIAAGYQAYQIHLNDRSNKLISFVQSYISGYINNIQTVMSSVQQSHGINMQTSAERARGLVNIAGQSFIQDQATRERDRYNTFAALLNDEKQAFQDKLAGTGLLSEATRMSYVANKEFYDKKAELQYQKLKWDLDTFAYLGNFLGAPGSSVSKTSELTTGQSIMSGAATGAAALAPTGNPIAIGIGAIAGGIGGGFLSNQG